MSSQSERQHGLRFLRQDGGVAALCACGWCGAVQADDDGARADYRSHVAYEESRNG